jgi:hypothetical protein
MASRTGVPITGNVLVREKVEGLANGLAGMINELR